MSAEDTGDALRERFATDGFLLLPQFLQTEAVNELRANVDRYIEFVVPQMPSESVFYEDKHQPETLKQIQQMSAHDGWFRELFVSGRFREVAERFLGGPVIPRNLQYFSKPPGIGRPTPPHQDGYYFMLDPCEAITLWLALDDVDEENGCVRYVRGSHPRGLRKHRRTGTLGFSQGIVGFPTDEDRRCEVATVAQAGDLLVHDAMTIHRADGNFSDGRSRRALGMIYYSQAAREDSVAHAAYQRKLAADMRAAGKI